MRAESAARRISRSCTASSIESISARSEARSGNDRSGDGRSVMISGEPIMPSLPRAKAKGKTRPDRIRAGPADSQGCLPQDGTEHITLAPTQGKPRSPPEGDGWPPLPVAASAGSPCARRCAVPGERCCLSPGPPIRQDAARPGPAELVLAAAGSRRRAWLSGGLPVPHQRGYGVFLPFGSPAFPPAPGDQRQPDGNHERQFMSGGRLRSPAERGSGGRGGASPPAGHHKAKWPGQAAPRRVRAAAARPRRAGSAPPGYAARWSWRR